MASINLLQSAKANNTGTVPGTPQPDTLTVTFGSNVQSGSTILVVAAVTLFVGGADAQVSNVHMSDSQGNPYVFLYAAGEIDGPSAYAHYPGNALFMVFQGVGVSTGPLTVSFQSTATKTVPGIAYFKGIAVFELSQFNGFFQNNGSVQDVGGTTVTVTDTLGRSIVSNSNPDGARNPTIFTGYQNGFFVFDFKYNGLNFFVGGYLGPAVLDAANSAVPPSITAPYLYSNTDYVIVSDGLGGTIAMAVFLPGLPISLPTLTCPSSTAALGVAYSSSFTVSGGTSPYTFSITAGHLPPGLNLNITTGLVSGSPISPGTFHYTGTVVDNLGATANASCVITIPGIVPIPAPLQVVCSLQVTALVNQPYNSSVVASGGTPPYTYAVTSGALPTGLTLNTATGQITGTPTVTGVFNYTITVTDSADTPVVVSQNCNLTLGTAITIVNCPDAL